MTNHHIGSLRPNLRASLYEDWYSPSLAQALMAQAVTLPWHEETVWIYGRRVTVPRRIVWIGDKDALYTYAGTRHLPTPWPSWLSTLRESLEVRLETRFNSVLGNYYHNGQDYMGYHQDNEPELGPDPLIASLSLGSARYFAFKHIKTGERIKLCLHPGSLLVMDGDCQHQWRHSLLKSKRVEGTLPGPRINLTFRFIYPP